MDIIDVTLKNEKERNIKMQNYYNDLISSLPIGSVVLKKIGNKEYCYLHYKEDGKTKNKYYGDSSNYDSLMKDISKRKHYENMLRNLKKEYIRIERMEKIL